MLAEQQQYRKILRAYGAVYREIDAGTMLSEICSSDKSHKHELRGYINDKPFHCITLNPDRFEQQIETMNDLECDRIEFCPAATFNGKSSALKNVVYWSGFVLEVDVKKVDGKKQILTEEQQQHALKQILESLKQQCFFGKYNGKGKPVTPFLPSHILQTSSGSFHLYYYAPVVAHSFEQRAEIHQQHAKIAEKIIHNYNKYKTTYDWSIKKDIDLSLHHKWEFDFSASANSVQMMRTPLSIHKRTGKQARVYRLFESENSYIRPDWYQLCAWAGCKPEVSRTDLSEQTVFTFKKSKAPEKKVSSLKENKFKSGKVTELPIKPKQLDMIGRKTDNRHTLGDYFGRQVFHLLKIINSGEAEKARDGVSFLLCNALLQLRHGCESALESTVKSVSPLFSEDFLEEDLRQYMSTTMKQRPHWPSGGSMKKGYPISLDKFNEKLGGWGLPLLKSTAKPRSQGLTPEQIRERQSAAAIATNKLMHARTLEAVSEAILKHANATQALIAKVAQVDVRTVQRYWREAKALAKEIFASNKQKLINAQTRAMSEETAHDRRSCSIYSPALSGGYDGNISIHNTYNLSSDDVDDDDLRHIDVYGQLDLV